MPSAPALLAQGALHALRKLYNVFLCGVGNAAAFAYRLTASLYKSFTVQCQQHDMHTLAQGLDWHA